jgi:hypothetical protein
MGGMMAMLQVVNAGIGSPAGPATHVSVTPKLNDLNPLNAADVMNVATVITPVNGAVDQAEWFLDTPGTPGTGTALPANTCAGGNNHCFTVPVAQLATLLATASTRNGPHVVWVRGHDANGWGVASGDTFTVDLTGALVSGSSVHSTPTNLKRANDLDGTTDLDVVGSAAAALPGWVITAVEVCMDGGALPACSFDANPAFDQAGPPPLKFGPFHTSFGLNIVSAANGTGANDPAAAIVAYSGAIPNASLPNVDGTYNLHVHACEAAAPLTVAVTPANCGRWNDATLTDLSFTVDQQGPATSNVVLQPNPNNGFQSGPGNAAYLNQERVDAILDDTAFGGSVISGGEVFISQPGVLPWCFKGALLPPLTGAACTPAPPAGFFGTGAEMVPVGGHWNVGPKQNASAFIPLPDVRAFPEGHVWFWIHGVDQAGNWGPFADGTGTPIAGSFADMILDKTPPTMTATATKHATTTGIVITATDPVSHGVNSNIVAAEWFVAPCTPLELATCFNDPGTGNGTPIAVPNPATSLTLPTLIVPNQDPGKSIYVRVMDAAGNWSVVAYNHPVITY